MLCTILVRRHQLQQKNAQKSLSVHFRTKSWNNNITSCAVLLRFQPYIFFSKSPDGWRETTKTVSPIMINHIKSGAKHSKTLYNYTTINHNDDEEGRSGVWWPSSSLWQHEADNAHPMHGLRGGRGAQYSAPVVQVMQERVVGSHRWQWEQSNDADWETMAMRAKTTMTMNQRPLMVSDNRDWGYHYCCGILVV